MKDIQQYITVGDAVVRTVLNRPKNFVKPDFNKNTFELLMKASEEMRELTDEILAGNNEKAVYEAGDVCAYLFPLMKECMERAGMKLCMYEGKVCCGTVACPDAVCACFDRERDE